jgi:hypothetical protein
VNLKHLLFPCIAILFGIQSHAQGLLIEKIGSSITLVIFSPAENGESPAFDLFTGVLERKDPDFLIRRSGSESIRIPHEWLVKIKPMGDASRDLFGNAELMLPIHKRDFSAKGFSYSVSPHGVINVTVKK